MKQYLSNFDSTPLNCDPTVFPGKIILILQKSNHIFPGKRKGDKNFILTYLDSSMTEVFPHYCLFFSILTIFRRKRGLKVGPKVLTLGASFFHKYSNPSKNFQTMFLFLRVLPLARIRQYCTILAEQGSKNLSKKAILWMLNQYAKCWEFLT